MDVNESDSDNEIDYTRYFLELIKQNQKKVFDVLDPFLLEIEPYINNARKAYYLLTCLVLITIVLLCYLLFEVKSNFLILYQVTQKLANESSTRIIT